MVAPGASTGVPGPAAAESDRIVDELRDGIVSGRIRAGAVLAERSIAAEYGVSRLPARQALAVLVDEGLVRPGRGRAPATVAEFGAAEAADILEACLAIDVLAVRAAAQRHTRESIAGLEALLDAADAARERGVEAEVRALLIRFRRQYVSLAGNSALEDVDGVLSSRLQAVVFRLPSVELTRREFRALHDAIAGRDADLAEAIVRRLIGGAVATRRASADTPSA